MKKTTEEFIKKAKEVHGDKYDYSKVDYRGALVKIIIVCPEHGEFLQTPNHHLCGFGCSKCSYEHLSDIKRTSTEEFVRKAREVHGDKYDYSKVDYRNNYTKVSIICPVHGEFLQRPLGHVHNQSGCPLCKVKR